MASNIHRAGKSYFDLAEKVLDHLVATYPVKDREVTLSELRNTYGRKNYVRTKAVMEFLVRLKFVDCKRMKTKRGVRLVENCYYRLTERAYLFFIKPKESG